MRKLALSGSLLMSFIACGVVLMSQTSSAPASASRPPGDESRIRTVASAIVKELGR